MTPRAICFDLDGVIVDSEALHQAAFCQTLSGYGLELTDQQYKAHFAGKTDAQGFIDYLLAIRRSMDINELLAEKSAQYTQLAATDMKLIDSTVSLIHLLVPHIQLALVTGSTRSDAVLALQSAGLSSYFTLIVSADDISRSKPHPEAYLLALHQLGSPLSRTIAVEDSPDGVTAAKAAGLYCIAITTTHSAAQLRHADYITPTLTKQLFTDILLP